MDREEGVHGSRGKHAWVSEGCVQVVEEACMALRGARTAAKGARTAQRGHAWLGREAYKAKYKASKARTR
jgi:hypothetical protein